MRGKIAIEEYWESFEVDTSSMFGFIDFGYLIYLNQRLQEVDRWLDEMDEVGIEIVVLSLTQLGVQGIQDKRVVVEFARCMNDYAAETLAKRDLGCFRTFACVLLQDSELAALEAKRACTELGCIGVLVNGFINMGDDSGMYLDEAQVLLFWQAINELNVFVYLHPRMPFVSQRKAYVGYPGLVGSVWGFGYEIVTHALCLMLSGFFDRFLKVNVMLGYFGEGLVLSLLRVEHRLRYQMLGSYGTHLRSLMDYLCDNFYVMTFGTFRMQGLLHTISEIGVDCVLFVVDYFYESMSEII